MTPAVILNLPRNAGAVGRPTGGTHRDRQVAELVAAAGLPAAELPGVRFEGRRWGRLRDGVLGSLRLDRRVPARYSEITRLGAYYAGYEHLVREHPAARVLVCQTIAHLPGLARFVRRHGWRVVVAPHDLERLAPVARQGRGWPLLLDEIDHLATADAVFCIAREERWLLRNLGVSADDLPYRPPADHAANLAAVRDRRRVGQPAGLLVMGSAVHPPTRDGTRELLSWLRRCPPPAGEAVWVVGAGTEMFADGPLPPNAAVLGGVDEDRLAGLLTSARAVVAHQTWGTGGLTRIPDMLTAGVPVVANRIAARSAEELAGVHRYDSPDELAATLAGPLAVPPPPPGIGADERRFVATLRRLAGAGGQAEGPA